MPASTVAPDSVVTWVAVAVPSSEGPLRRSCAGCRGASTPSTLICGVMVAARASLIPGRLVGAGAAEICAWKRVRTDSSRIAASIAWNRV